MRASKSPLKILVVDDQFIMRTIISKQIEIFLKDKIVYDIITATGCEQALNLTLENKIDIVFTDLQMDGDCDSGYRLTRQLKARYPDSQVFITSNNIGLDIEPEALDAGASGCIQLPMIMSHLEKAFCDYLE